MFQEGYIAVRDEIHVEENIDGNDNIKMELTNRSWSGFICLRDGNQCKALMNGVINLLIPL